MASLLILALLSGNLPPTQRFSQQLDRSSSLLQFTSAGHALGFTADGMYVATGSHSLHVDFVGANPVQPQADRLVGAGLRLAPEGKSAPLTTVVYTNLWDGITLAYTASAGGIYTTTYTLAPGADPAGIRLRYHAPLTLNANGTLSSAFVTGTLTESAPIAWQEIEGQRVPVQVVFHLIGPSILNPQSAIENPLVGFQVGMYNPGYALSIDPTLAWNTFLGSDSTDYAYGIALDGSGNIYVTGVSAATWGTPVNAFAGLGDTFVAKLNSNGALVWNTFMGSTSADDVARSIAVDGSGNIYVAGYSEATWGTPVNAYAGGRSVFAARLNNSGVLQWNTFLGPAGGQNVATGIVVDMNGNVYIAGYFNGAWGSPLNAFMGYYDAFAARLNSSGVLQWNTFMGSAGYDYAYGIAVDGSGNVYVTGDSSATWGTPVNAYAGGYNDVFAARLNSSGVLQWNTFMGSAGYDYARGIAVDGNGNIYVTGHSTATWGSPVNASAGGQEAFAARLNSSGVLQWNTFLGSADDDWSWGIAVDGGGDVYVSGYSFDTWGSPVNAYTDMTDGFAAKLNSSGVRQWHTFMGSVRDDWSSGIAVDGSGNVYVAGSSTATWGTPVNAYVGGYNDAFVVRLNSGVPAAQTITVTTHAPAIASLDANFTVAASASSGLSVSYSATGVCTNVGAVFTMTSSTGTCTVHYNQAGNVNYSAATEVTENVIAAVNVVISGNVQVDGTTMRYVVGGVNKSVTSGSDGTYSINVPYNWSGIITPTKTGYIFMPVNRTYSNVLMDQTDQNYTVAILYQVYLPLVIR